MVNALIRILRKFKSELESLSLGTLAHESLFVGYYREKDDFEKAKGSKFSVLIQNRDEPEADSQNLTVRLNPIITLWYYHELGKDVTETLTDNVTLICDKLVNDVSVLNYLNGLDGMTVHRLQIDEIYWGEPLSDFNYMIPGWKDNLNCVRIDFRVSYQTART